MATASVFHLAIVHVTVITRCLGFNEMLRMCYFNSNSRYRITRARFDSFDIDFSLCTHYIYAYGRIDNPPTTISPMDPDNELGNTGAYRDFTSRDLGPNKTPVRMLSIGGPNATTISVLKNLTETTDSMQTFSHNTYSFLLQHDFGGLDIDWPYSNVQHMRADLVRLLQALRREFDHHSVGQKLLLTVKCAGVYNRLGYDVAGISTYADYVLLSSDDIGIPEPNKNWFRSALYASNMSVNATVREWLRHGLPVNKAIVGISALATTQKLVKDYTPGAAAGGSLALGTEYCNPKGLALPEVCDVASSAQVDFDNASQMHYMTFQDVWIGYENTSSIKSKMDWMKSLKIRGVMFASMDEDDFTGMACNQGNNPLLTFIKAQSVLSTPTTDSSLKTTHGSMLAKSNGIDFNSSETNTTRPCGPGNACDPQREFASPDEGSVSGFYFILVLVVISFIIVFLSCFFVIKDMERTRDEEE